MSLYILSVYVHTQRGCVCVCVYSPLLLFLGTIDNLLCRKKKEIWVSIHVFASSLGVVIIGAYVMFLC